MTLDLEDRLRTALHDEADRAPLDAPEWRQRQPPPSSRRPWLAAASVAVIVAGGAGIATVARDGSGSSGSLPFEPEGDEYPLESIDPADVDRLASFFDDDLVKPGSVVAFTAGMSSAFAYSGFVAPQVGDHVAESRCVSALSPGSDLCTSDDALPAFLPVFFGVGGRTGQYAWTNVPDGAAFVQLEIGTRSQWQRPIGSVVVFPFDSATDVPSSGGDAIVTAFTELGDVIVRYDRDTLAVTMRVYAADQPVGDNLARVDNRRVQIAAEAAMRTCLADAGLTDPLAPAGSDASRSWDRCLEQAQAAATAKFEELGGELVENPEDDPGYVIPGGGPSS